MKTWRIEDFAVSADHRKKLKENEKKDKYLDLARDFKKLCNLKVTNKEDDWRILRRVLETWGNLLSLKLQ